MSILYYLGLVQWVVQKVRPRKDRQLGPVRGVSVPDADFLWEKCSYVKHGVRTDVKRCRPPPPLSILISNDYPAWDRLGQNIVKNWSGPHLHPGCDMHDLESQG